MAKQRLEALGARLADADQNAGRERHAQFAREPHRLETRLGPLVGRAVVNAARLAQARAERLQHDALAGRHLPQPAISARVITPGLTCGSSPVSRSTSAHIASR